MEASDFQKKLVKDVTIRVWDLAGQLEYLTTHQVCFYFHFKNLFHFSFLLHLQIQFIS